MPKGEDNRVGIRDVIDLREQGLEAEVVLDRDEAISRGWMEEDTEKTRVVQLGGRLIEIDYRKRVSADGKRVVWITGQNPNSKKVLAEGNKRLRERVKNGERPFHQKKRQSLGAVLKKFLNTPVTRWEYEKLPDKVKNSLQDFLGGELTRADVAAFQLMGRAMEGDIMAFKEIADRVEGKAVQRSENKNLNVNYQDYLKGLAGFEDEEEELD